MGSSLCHVTVRMIQWFYRGRVLMNMNVRGESDTNHQDLSGGVDHILHS